MRKLLLLSVCVVGCAGNGGPGTPPPPPMNFTGEYFGAVRFCPVHAGNARLVISASGDVSGTMFNACTDVTEVADGEIETSGLFTGDLASPTRSFEGTMQLSQDDFSGHLTLQGSTHGIFVNMKKTQ